MPDAGDPSAHIERKTSGQSILPVRAGGIKVISGDAELLLDVPEVEFSGRGISVIMGPNGAGKSLLLRVLAGLVVPTEGKVSWGGTPPSRTRARRLGFVFQKPVLLRRSVLSNMLYPLRAAGFSKGEAMERALAGLRIARLEGLAKRPARVLSGGEQQRLAMARALALEPEVLFLDEPTASLDPPSAHAIERMILDAKASGMRIVMIGHEVAVARRLADEILFLNAGRILERSPSEAFFAAPSSIVASSYLCGELIL